MNFFKKFFSRFKSTKFYKFLFILKHQRPKISFGYYSNKNYQIGETSLISNPYLSRHVIMRSLLLEYIKSKPRQSEKLNFLNAGCGDGLMRQVFEFSHFDKEFIKIQDFFNTFDYYTNEYFDIDYKKYKKDKEIYRADIENFTLSDNFIDQFPENFVKEHLKGSLSDRDFINKFESKRFFFDFVILFDVLEHVTNPFNVIENLILMMKKQSLIFITVPFLQEYHEDPIDCFRYTHHGIKSLFNNYLIENKLNGEFEKYFEIQESFYDISQRRRKAQDDKLLFKNVEIKDSYGGFRETWHLFISLRKLF